MVGEVELPAGEADEGFDGENCDDDEAELEVGDQRCNRRCLFKATYCNLLITDVYTNINDELRWIMFLRFLLWTLNGSVRDMCKCCLCCWETLAQRPQEKCPLIYIESIQVAPPLSSRKNIKPLHLHETSSYVYEGILRGITAILSTLAYSHTCFVFWEYHKYIQPVILYSLYSSMLSYKFTKTRYI